MPDGLGDEEEETPGPSLEIPPLAGAPNVAVEKQWKLIGHNKKVLEGWKELCRSIPENAKRCFEHLSNDPTKRIPSRCYELKHKHYAGVWGYEIGSGQRVYYKLRPGKREILIYYAGKHPRSVP